MKIFLSITNRQAAADIVTGAAAGDVSVTLPPSSYDLPVQLIYSTRGSGLIFGIEGRHYMIMGGMESAK